MRMFLLKLVPAWLVSYRTAWFGGDLSAGIVTALMVVPQSMAYAMLAGLPPVCGLYASVLPVLVYAWLGTSSVQSVGTMAITSVMMGGVLAQQRPASPEEAVAIACGLALLCGTILLGAGLLRLGSLMSLISRPVLSGFTTGSAVMIAWSQIPYLLGPRASVQTFAGMPLPDPKIDSSLLGLGACLALWLAGPMVLRLRQRLRLSVALGDLGVRLVPFAVIVGAALVVYLAGADTIRLVGEVPSGLPRIGPHWITGAGLQQPLERTIALLPSALSMALMVFLFGQSSALSLSRKRQEPVDSNRELLALGASNLAASISGGLPVTGSLSRSAVNAQAGASSQLAGVIAVLVLLVALATSTRWLGLLPMPALAATILVAVVGMMQWHALAALWRIDRRDALAYLATALAVILLGFNAAMALGIVLSLVLLGPSWRHGHLLSRLLSTRATALEVVPVELTAPGQPVRGLLGVHCRIEGALVFVNAEQTAETLRTRLMAFPVPTALILDLSELTDLDASALNVLDELARQSEAAGSRLVLVRPRTTLDARLRRDRDLLARLGVPVFDTLGAARHAAGRL
jgi:SulP family sulfate permease